MKRRLFLTGPMGCGKSTAILTALGEKLPDCGGFLTRRTRDSRGHAASFSLESPDGKRRETFLDFTAGRPKVNMAVFAGCGAELLQEGGVGTVPCILDEIGGVELLCPEFTQALDALLRTDTPVLGVIKGEGPAGALIEALGLSGEYEAASRRLRQRLREDGDTLLYECSQFDEQARLLAECWVKEYLHD